MAMATFKCEFPRRQAMLSISDNEEQSGGERMRYISLFSGIEAASVAWESLGWKPMAFAEVDEFPSAVLAHRFPNVPNLGDVTKVDWKEFVRKHGKPDVVVGGSPCQSFSVAGGRESLDGESRLMFEYIRALREIRPKWFLWENVPGVLNTRDDAFAQLLGEVQDIGYVSVAWRVLDAQFFGVAQRRRRVFLVGHLGDGGGAAAVLFESESVSGNTQTSREKREELARAAGRGASARGGEGDCLNPWDVQSKRIFPEDGTAPTLQSGSGEGMTIQPSVLRAQTIDYKQTPKISDEISHTLTHEGRGGIHSAVAFKYSAGAAARTMPTYSDGSCNTLTADYHAPAVALQTGHTSGNGSGINTDDVSYTVSTSSDQAVAFAQTQYGEDVAGTLTARHDSSPCADRGQNVLCMASAAAKSEIGEQICNGVGSQYFEEGHMPESYVLKVRGGADTYIKRDGKVGTAGKGALVEREVTYTLAASQDKTILTDVGGTSDDMAVTIHDGSKWVVRRLTPVECERLQGFPDGWTDIPYKGKEHPPDTPRYKAIGNSMATPVMRWIGKRIQMVQEIMDEMEQ